MNKKKKSVNKTSSATNPAVKPRGIGAEHQVVFLVDESASADAEHNSSSHPRGRVAGYSKTISNKTVLVFGVFDRLHDGHRYFLREARKLGNRLVVVVAEDISAKNLKNRLPKQNVLERQKAILDEKLADEVVVGDRIKGSWNVLKKLKPHTIAFGYDQTQLKEAIYKAKKEFDFPLSFSDISALEPLRLHTSILDRIIPR